MGRTNPPGSLRRRNFCFRASRNASGIPLVNEGRFIRLNPEGANMQTSFALGTESLACSMNWEPNPWRALGSKMNSPTWNLRRTSSTGRRRRCGDHNRAAFEYSGCKLSQTGLPAGGNGPDHPDAGRRSSSAAKAVGAKPRRLRNADESRPRKKPTAAAMQFI
jgi:hypothetical protein